MTIHWKAVEQYFTVVLFVNPLTARVKPWVIQSFLTFDSMTRTLMYDHSLESCCCGFQFNQVCNFGKVSTLDLALSGVKELRGLKRIKQSNHCWILFTTYDIRRILKTKHIKHPGANYIRFHQLFIEWLISINA